jgi:5-methylcytosine-specific restriction endonuclease McrA
MSYGARRYFYNSKLWKQVRQSVWIKQNLLCAICGKPVYVDGISEYLPKGQRRTGIVHHKIWLDNNNIEDDNITINEDNLIGVCKECHENIHHANMSCRKDMQFDEEGNIIPRQ